MYGEAVEIGDIGENIYETRPKQRGTLLWPERAPLAQMA